MISVPNEQAARSTGPTEKLVFLREFSRSKGKAVKWLIIVERHPEGYVAYPIGLKGIVVGEGATREEAIADVKSAIRFHIETFGE